MAHVDTAVVLTSVARLVAEATSLEDVVSRLARVLRDVIPYERMHVLRLDRADSVVLYTALASGELDETPRVLDQPVVQVVVFHDRTMRWVQVWFASEPN